MKSLLKFLAPYRVGAALGPFFKLLEASFELFIPIAVASLIDVGIGGGDTGYILRMAGLMAALSLVGLVCSVTAQYFAAKAAVGFSSALRAETFSHIQSLSYSDLDSIGTATLITRLTGDIDTVQNGLNLTLRLLLRSPFVVFGAMIMAFTIDTRTALIFAVVIIALSAVVFGIMLASMPIYCRVRNALDRVLTLTRENLNGARVIRAFCREDKEIEGFSEANNTLSQLQTLAGRISAAMNPITFLIVNIAVAALIYSGALKVDGGLLTRGEVVALYNYMAQILVELIKLANLIISISKALACAKRVSAVLAVEPEMTAGSEMPEADENAPAIEFDGVSMRYRGASGLALENVTLSIPRGSRVGVIGGTGSGKSTLVSLIPRFYDCESGCVRVFGRDVRAYPFDALRRLIGFVPQKAMLFRASVRDNILYGDSNASDGDIYAALDTARAAEIVDRFEDGLDHEVEQGGRNLSGGQRQRLTIARALVRRPRILILDDSASALDAATEAALRRSLAAFDDMTTVVTVSQRVSSVKGCDIIVALDDGHVKGIGTHSALLRDCPYYREIAESQEVGQ